MNLISVIILVVGTIAIVVFSWVVSIKARRYHGVLRFFSFESILILALINAGYWFDDPFSIRQLFSWFFLFCSIVLAIYGVILISKAGKPVGQMEATTKLIEVGVYKYIRHPMYMSLILLGIGAFLKHVSWQSTVLVLIDCAAAYGTAKMEEKELVAKFGADYQDYMKRTWMFLPLIF